MNAIQKIKPEKKQIDIPAPKVVQIEVTVEGITPLLMHQFGKKARDQMENAQGQKAKKGKEARDPKAEYLECIYRDEDGDEALPVVNFKAAMLRAWELVGLKNKNAIRFGIMIPGEFVKVEGKHRMRRDYVRLANGVASLTYRAEFPKWSVTVPMRVNINVISVEQALNVIAEAGQSCGVGDWRPEKSSGTFGMWKIKQALEVGA